MFGRREDVHMPAASPQECLAYGRRCAELAEKIEEPQLRTELLLLAQKWLLLAAYLESHSPSLQASDERAEKPE